MNSKNIILILLLLFFFFRLFNYNKKENYENRAGCPDVLKNKSNFCNWSLDENKCKCVFQKDNLNHQFDSFSPCCNNICETRNEDNCVKDRGVYYWCIRDNKCVKQNAYIDNNRISGNNCGLDVLTNNVLRPYTDKESCLRDIDPCSKYKNKNDCIKDNNCGYCTNINNVGKCVEGTASGPINLFKYNFCVPNRRNRNAWFHGSGLFTTNRRTFDNRRLVN